MLLRGGFGALPADTDEFGDAGLLHGDAVENSFAHFRRCMQWVTMMNCVWPLMSPMRRVKRPTLASSAGVHFVRYRRGFADIRKMAISSASAVIAFSPPESKRTFCRRLPGGEGGSMMPASPELSGSVSRISAMPPPKMVRKAKFLLMEWKASENFSLVARSTRSAMACCVSAMD